MEHRCDILTPEVEAPVGKPYENQNHGEKNYGEETRKILKDKLAGFADREALSLASELRALPSTFPMSQNISRVDEGPSPKGRAKGGGRGGGDRRRFARRNREEV